MVGIAVGVGGKVGAKVGVMEGVWGDDGSIEITLVGVWATGATVEAISFVGFDFESMGEQPARMYRATNKNNNLVCFLFMVNSPYSAKKACKNS